MAYDNAQLIGVRPIYSVGTITLVAGERDFTCVGTMLQSIANAWPGDEIETTNGKRLTIATITSDTKGTLRDPCPADCAGENLPVYIRPQPDGSRSSAAVRNLIAKYGTGYVAALADLTLEPGQVPAAGQVQGSFVAGDLPTAPDLSPYMKIETYDKNGKKADVYDAGNFVENTTAHNDKGALLLTNAEREAIKNRVSTVGQVIYSTSTKPPYGCLSPNGTLIKRADYPPLWQFANDSGMIVSDADWLDVTKNNWGKWSTGDGSTTFRIPMILGEFLRVWDNGRGVDNGRVAGSWQGDAIRNITGGGVLHGSDQGTNLASVYGAFSGNVLSNYKNGGDYVNSGANSYGSFSLDASSVVPTATENRPRSIALPAYICYI
ncbi:hypothetical protein [Bartonella sp. LJL80]